METDRENCSHEEMEDLLQEYHKTMMELKGVQSILEAKEKERSGIQRVNHVRPNAVCSKCKVNKTNCQALTEEADKIQELLIEAKQRSETSIEELKKVLDAKDSEIKKFRDAENNYLEAKLELDDFTSKLEESKSLTEIALKENDDMKKKTEVAKSKLGDLRCDYSSIKEEIKSNDEIIEDLQGENALLSAQVKSESVVVKNAENGPSIFDEVNKPREDVVKEFQRLRSEYDDFKRIYQQEIVKTTHLRNEISKFQRNLVEKRDEKLKASNDHINEVTKIIKDMDMVIKECKALIENNQKEEQSLKECPKICNHFNMQSAIFSVEKDRNQLDSSKAAASSETRSAKIMLRTLERQLVDLKKQNKKLSMELDSFTALKSSVIS